MVFMSVDCTKESSNSAEDKTVYYKTDSIKELAVFRLLFMKILNLKREFAT